MFRHAQPQKGSGLVSLLLGLALSLALLLLWQRLLLQARTLSGVQQQRAEGLAEIQWLQGQLKQDFLMQDRGPCVVPSEHEPRLAGPGALRLSPRLLSQPLLASQGFGPEADHTLTRIVTTATPALMAYLAAAEAYDWTLSRCDVAWSFRPRGWTLSPPNRVAIELPGGWPLGPHPLAQPGLLSLQVVQRVEYRLQEDGLVRQWLNQPALTPILASRLNVFEVRPWQRLGCEGQPQPPLFQTRPIIGAEGIDLSFYEVVMGWQAAEGKAGLTMALTWLPQQAQAC